MYLLIASAATELKLNIYNEIGSGATAAKLIFDGRT